MRRRRARTVARRRPPSGLLASSGRSGAVVSAGLVAPRTERRIPVGRWVRLATTVCVVATVVVVGVALWPVGSGGPGAEATIRVTVSQGDTLWSIAREAEPDRDPRAVIDDIRALNALAGDTIAVGEVLVVPTRRG